LQADPHIDGATQVGGFNRYAYVKNNPLNAMDPSGYGILSKVWKKLRPFVGMIVGVALVAMTGGAETSFLIHAWYGAAMLGAATSMAGAAAMGGNLRDVLKAGAIGAASGAAFFGVGTLFRAGGALAGLNGAAKVAAQMSIHGTVGGIMSELQGGKFGHGFASAALSKGSSILGGAMKLDTLGNFILTSATGGTASLITGGKFANGAQTAALAFAVNQLASEGMEKINGGKEDAASRISQYREKISAAMNGDLKAQREISRYFGKNSVTRLDELDENFAKIEAALSTAKFREASPEYIADAKAAGKAVGGYVDPADRSVMYVNTYLKGSDKFFGAIIAHEAAHSAGMKGHQFLGKDVVYGANQNVTQFAEQVGWKGASVNPSNYACAAYNGVGPC
jgi:hypothetical protein